VFGDYCYRRRQKLDNNNLLLHLTEKGESETFKTVLFILGGLQVLKFDFPGASPINIRR